MEAPLLEGRKASDLNLIGEDGDYVEAKGDVKAWKTVFCLESIKVWKIAGPIAFQLLCQFGTHSVTTMFVGHVGNLQLSSFSIALTVIGNFAFGFLLGMGSALETLCGQAFGAGQIHILGVYMQRSMIILFVSSLLILPFYVFATPILKFVGQPDDIAEYAGFYALLIIPHLFSLVVSFPTQKFLQAQSKVSVLAWIGAFALIGQILLCWLFVIVFGWGAVGAAIAFDLISWSSAIAQFVYVVFWCTDSWKGFSLSAFRDIWAFVRLSLASAVMLCLEVWYLMCLNILAGNLDNAVIEVGSISICMNINEWEIMVFIGINAAIGVRVSNELGLGHPRTAKYAVYVTVFQSLLIGILCMIIVFATRNYFSIIFTDSDEMQRGVAKLANLLGITMLLNSVQQVISGVAIGGGWQALVAYINLSCYYIFGIPLGYVLGYVAGFKVMGIWGGMIGGMTLQTVVLVFVLCRTNWKREAEKTMERMQKWGGQQTVN